MSQARQQSDAPALLAGRSFTIRDLSGKVLHESASHSDVRLAARSIRVAHEIFDPSGVRLGFRPKSSATHMDPRQFLAGDHLLEDFDS